MSILYEEEAFSYYPRNDFLLILVNKVCTINGTYNKTF